MSDAVPARTAWVDIARGATIVLVVLYHVGAGASADLLPGEYSSYGAWWLAGNNVLVPLRMPLFFVLSGMLATGALRRPWSRVRRPRIADMLWPYLLWSVVFALTTWPRYTPQDPEGGIWSALRGIVVLDSPYWFIAVLPILFLLTRFGLRRPRVLLIASVSAFMLGPMLQELLQDAGPISAIAVGTRRITEYLVWFVSGAVLRERLLSLGGAPRPALAIVCILVFSPTAVALQVLDLSYVPRRLLVLLAAGSGIIGAVAVAACAAQVRWIAALGRQVGSRTLVIYLVHPLVVSAVVVLWRDSALASAVAGSASAGLLLVPGVTVLAVVVSLLVSRVLARWGPRWVLAAP